MEKRTGGIKELILCEYGCGKEANHQFKNGRWCCSEFLSQCPVMRKKNGDGNRKEKIERIIPEACDYGCGKKPKYKFKSGKYCCSVSQNSCPGIRRKLSSSATGYKQPENRKQKQSMKLKELWNDPNSKYHSEERNEKLRIWMLNGHAVYMNKCIKNPSKEEVKLRNIIKDIYPECEFQHKVFNYALDVAILEYKIAIEYDGWFHFDCQEHIDYHKNREKRIKKEGWKFIKYNIFKPFPSVEKIKNDLVKKISLVRRYNSGKK